MIYKVFAIYDSKVEAYLKPFMMRARGEAIRGWISAVNDPNMDFNKFPQDYTLFEIAEFNDEKGTYTNLKTPFSHGLALEYVNKIEDEKINNERKLDNEISNES